MIRRILDICRTIVQKVSGQHLSAEEIAELQRLRNEEAARAAQTKREDDQWHQLMRELKAKRKS